MGMKLGGMDTQEIWSVLGGGVKWEADILMFYCISV